MALKIKHVADLMGESFRIPSYQRGYRWERKQIEQLLDDLNEFANSITRARRLDYQNQHWNRKNPNAAQKSITNELNIGYYCLQPLAVTSQGSFYDVIDGQQRLTTIYLILCYLSNQLGTQKIPYDKTKDLADSLYSLTYETREEGFFINKEFINNPKKSPDNIDFYFMTQGYKVIEEWFARFGNQMDSILKLILPNEFKPNGNDDDNDDDDNQFLHDVRFIWYETPAKTSIKTFNNLNYGKIGLTASELVKALLFECDRYEFAKREIERGIAFARSSKWSAMEESLHDPYFWGMLSPLKEEQDLHLELILSFVASDIDSQQKYSEIEGWNNSDEDWVFNVFSKAVSDNKLHNVKGDILSNITERVEYLWNCIQKVYTVFQNWYDNRVLYHRIGLYIFLTTHYSGKNHRDIIKELYSKYLSNLKASFDYELNHLIGNTIRITAKTEDSKIDENGTTVTYERTKKLNELKYGEDDNAIRKILLSFNVEMTLLNTQDNPLFPFHLASKSEFDLKSLEHIHPQNLDDDSISFTDFKNWFNSRNKILLSECNLNEPSNKSLASAIQNLNNNLVDEKTFLKNKSTCLTDLAEIDKKFDELAGMDPKVMHTLYNLALVDLPTNAALSNKLIDDKRQTLIDRTKNGETYVPIGTWHAFNKHFSKRVKDMKFWTIDDRNAYFEEIKTVYDKYTKLRNI